MKFVHVIDRCGLLPLLSMVVVKNSAMHYDCQNVYQKVGNRAIDFGIYGLQALSSALS